MMINMSKALTGKVDNRQYQGNVNGEMESSKNERKATKETHGNDNEEMSNSGF